MQSAPRQAIALAILLPLSAGCVSPADPAGAKDGGPLTPTSNPTEACRLLHEASAAEWPDRLPAVHRLGKAAEPLLIAEFERTPAAAGAQATVAMLARIGGQPAAELCRQLVRERAPLAVEAALALGELPGSADDQALLQCVQDRHSDITLRTAAACSLARHGEREHAPRFVEAIVRAGTPNGIQDQRELGLPAKFRWARERYFVQRMLQAAGHKDLGDALDSDAPWPTLEKLAPQVAARLRGQ